jgi:uncharacterized protein YjdB
MRVQSIASFAVAVVFALFTAACGSSTSPTIVTSVAVTGAGPAVGGTAQFTATATMSDGSTLDVTQAATWSSSNASALTVSATGVVTGVAPGTATIQATYQSVSGSEQVTD